MKIAVCLSGQIRTGVESSVSILRYIGDLLPYCDFFIHTWDTETIAYCEYIEDDENFIGMTQDEINKLQERSHVESFPEIKLSDERIRNFINSYNPKKYRVDNYKEYMDNVPHIILPPIYYTWYESNKLKMDYEKENGFKYDLVIKLRPDIIFKSTRSLIEDIKDLDLESNKLYVWRWDTIHVPNAIIKIEDVHFLGNSNVLDIVTDFIHEKEERFFNHIDRQILHHNFVTEKGIEVVSFVKFDFIVYRYFQHRKNLTFDEIINKHFSYLKDL